jgi:hypothetical protein
MKLASAQIALGVVVFIVGIVLGIISIPGISLDNSPTVKSFTVQAITDNVMNPGTITITFPSGTVSEFITAPTNVTYSASYYVRLGGFFAQAILGLAIFVCGIVQLWKIKNNRVELHPQQQVGTESP